MQHRSATVIARAFLDEELRATPLYTTRMPR
jgi:hypothetical protein